MAIRRPVNLSTQMNGAGCPGSPSSVRMLKSLIWANRERTSLEHFRLSSSDGTYILEGTVIMLLEQMPTKISYKIECDTGWGTTSLHLLQERAGENSHLDLGVNKERVWSCNGSMLDFATGLFDVDLEISPATNTIPIRRMNLYPTS